MNPNYNNDILPKEVTDYWSIEHITAARPRVFYFYKDDSLDDDCEWELECIPHCVVEVSPQSEICWYEMIDFDTEDPWKIEGDFEYEI